MSPSSSPAAKSKRRPVSGTGPVIVGVVCLALAASALAAAWMLFSEPARTPVAMAPVATPPMWQSAAGSIVHALPLPGDSNEPDDLSAPLKAPRPVAASVRDSAEEVAHGTDGRLARTTSAPAASSAAAPAARAPRTASRVPANAVARTAAPVAAVAAAPVVTVRIPADVQLLFDHARETLEMRHYAQAADEFRQVASRLSAPELATAPGAEMMRTRARDYLDLAQSTLSPIAKPAGPVTGTRTYTVEDREVIAPVEIVRPVPAWVDVNSAHAVGVYQGLVEVIVDPTGAVQSATVRRSITPAYDAALLAATKTWRFQPATLDGTPVRFRKLFEIIVHSR